MAGAAVRPGRRFRVWRRARAAGWCWPVVLPGDVVGAGGGHRFGQIVQAPADMEANRVSGKLVVPT